jgi:hypothetical protein
MRGGGGVRLCDENGNDRRSWECGVEARAESQPTRKGVFKRKIRGHVNSRLGWEFRMGVVVKTEEGTRYG